MKKSVLNRIEKTIEKYGKEYIPAILPVGVRRGEVGDCFDVCVIEALRNPHLRYVEGVASIPRTEADWDKEKEWIIHSWLTDGKHAFDPTWNAFKEGKEILIPSIYLGIEMDTKAVVDFMKTTKYKSVLIHGPKNKVLSEKCFKI